MINIKCFRNNCLCAGVHGSVCTFVRREEHACNGWIWVKDTWDPSCSNSYRFSDSLKVFIRGGSCKAGQTFWRAVSFLQDSSPATLQRGWDGRPAAWCTYITSSPTYATWYLYLWAAPGEKQAALPRIWSCKSPRRRWTDETKFLFPAPGFPWLSRAALVHYWTQWSVHSFPSAGHRIPVFSTHLIISQLPKFCWYTTSSGFPCSDLNLKRKKIPLLSFCGVWESKNKFNLEVSASCFYNFL